MPSQRAAAGTSEAAAARAAARAKILEGKRYLQRNSTECSFVPHSSTVSFLPIRIEWIESHNAQPSWICTERKHRNRLSAALHRQRKNETIEELSALVQQLRDQNAALRAALLQRSSSTTGDEALSLPVTPASSFEPSCAPVYPHLVPVSPSPSTPPVSSYSAMEAPFQNAIHRVPAVYAY